MGRVAPDRIIGRGRELAALEGFVSSVGAGATMLVLAGEAGVGKSMLWSAGTRVAAEHGVRVLETRPVQAEARFAFAALGDVLGGSLDDSLLGLLPAPQADALRVALLLERPRGSPPGERVIAAAALSALRAMSVQRPTVVAIDDVQWLDSPSAAVLGYAWRRLRDERVGWLVTCRTGEPLPAPFADLDGAARLQVEPLDLATMHHLLEERLGLRLSRPLLRRVHELAAGNAFFALELGRVLQHRDLLRAPPGALPVPGELHVLLSERLAEFPAATREALATAAALARPTLALVAADTCGAATLRPAFEARIVELEGDRLRFTHPLLASAAYSTLDTLARRELHARLAVTVESEEERARHLALATAAPDEDVAAALEAAAEHARVRGAHAAVAELCEHARALTPPDRPDAAHRRLVAAARGWFMAGDPERYRELLEEALTFARSDAARAEVLTFLADVELNSGDQIRAVDYAREAVAAAAGCEAGVQALAAQELAGTLMFTRQDLPEAVERCATAAKLAGRAGLPGLVLASLGVKGAVELLLGRREAAATFAAVRELDAAPFDWRVISARRFYLGHYFLLTDRVTEASALLRDCLAEAAETGDETSHGLIAGYLALSEFLAGRWPEAIEAATNGLEAGVQAGQLPHQALSLAVRALVRACRGEAAAASADAARMLALAGDRGLEAARTHALWAIGLLALAQGKPEETVHVLGAHRERMLRAGIGEPGAIRSIPDEIEALVALGRIEEATRLLDWLETQGYALDRTSALATAGRCRALLQARTGDLEGALRALRTALDEHVRLTMPFERARTLLVLGTVQRRAKQRSAARETLGEAQSGFVELGAAPWADRARAELARIGGRPRTQSALTPTEQRLASLIAEGRSNKQAAAALFVTPKTVETQLSRIYRKLGVHSRLELANHLHSDAGATEL
ncbi:AAA family ATPase [Solirubrobacter ginsenosidimutans]|uniref:AAA family ATPase n=1 Tax=Solirubrobacter ginsenosidimutans TaxID=490573 RepID=A0A9X3RZA8_9ACTN|nr:LuxR family transcriptional regulator [Solirubrobacter ginsenosidimutans]MDA0160740.1 AAA family ATPase [Solirubrobacter ginsenosidimutans]